MSYSLLFEEKKKKKNELKAYREEILFLEHPPRARFETEWDTDAGGEWMEVHSPDSWQSRSSEPTLVSSRELSVLSHP